MRLLVNPPPAPQGRGPRRVRSPFAVAEFAKVGLELSRSFLHLAANLLRRSFFLPPYPPGTAAHSARLAYTFHPGRLFWRSKFGSFVGLYIFAILGRFGTGFGCVVSPAGDRSKSLFISFGFLLANSIAMQPPIEAPITPIEQLVVVLFIILLK